MSQDGVHGSRVFQRSKLARPLLDQLITARPIWHEGLLTVINDILDFSRIEAGRLTIAPFDCNLLQGLSDVLKPLILRAEAKHLRMRFTASSDVPELVCVDLDRVRQIIVNLCGNAIKFTHTGSVELELSVASATGSHLTLAFSVRDTGIGIEPEKLASVFEALT